ncbi:hypothetical protein VTK26DRAFT_3059 [Humicola hyalothermophila]
MCARMSPTRRSSQNSDWVVTDFETGVHTRTRSPQLNDDNLSSNQVADALANDMTTAFARLIPSDARTAVSYEARPLPASVHNKPPSNGDSSSTETAGTDDTVTGPSSATTTATTTTTTTTTTTSPQGPAPNPSSPSSGDAAPLTQSNMALHQRELFAQLCLGFVGDASISGWVAGSGTGARLLPLPPGSSTGSGKASLLSSMPSSSSSSSSAAANSTGAAAHYSCPVVSSPSLGAASVTSHSSLGGQQDWMFVPLPLQFDEEVAAAGAWCEMAVGSRVRRREASLSLSECSI